MKVGYQSDRLVWNMCVQYVLFDIIGDYAITQGLEPGPECRSRLPSFGFPLSLLVKTRTPKSSSNSISQLPVLVEFSTQIVLGWAHTFELV